MTSMNSLTKAALNSALAHAAMVSTRQKKRIDLWGFMVWAFAHEMAQVYFDGGTDPLRTSTDGCASIARINEIGAKGGAIQGGQWKHLNSRIHPDAAAAAAAVHRLRDELGDKAAEIVVHAARRCEVPEPATIQPTPFPTPVDRQAPGQRFRWAEIGGVRVDYRIDVACRVPERKAITKRRGPHVQVVGYETEIVDVEFCPITWWPHPSWNAMADAMHDAWVTGMERLAEILAEEALRDHELTGFNIACARE